MRPARNGSVTLEQVAEAASVSRATVSRVINGDPRVGDSARQAVEAAVKELRYIPNRAARSLVTRRSDSIAVVIPEPTTQLFGDPFFPRFLRGVSNGLAQNDLQLVLLMPQGRADEARVARYLGAGHTDGVLLVSLHGSDPMPADLQRLGIPVVVGGRPPVSGISYVDVDNRAGASSAVAHLASTDRTSIVTIAGPQDMPAGADRLAGFRQTLTDAGRRVDEGRIEVADFSLEGGRRAMERLLDRVPQLDAVFVASDLMAVGAIEALGQAGRRVPEDVAVIAYDDSPLAASSRPPLSSVRQPIEEMGREMTRLLLDRIREPDAPPRHVILDTSLVLRESSRPMR